MAQQKTPNLDLVLPYQSEAVEVNDINGNYTKIDTAYGNLSDQIATLIKSKTYNNVSPTLIRGSSTEYVLMTDLLITGKQIISVYVTNRDGYSFVPWKDSVNNDYWQLLDPHNTALSGQFSFIVYYIDK